MAWGMLVDFEGIDGSGTTTHAKRLVEHLTARGIQAYLTSEPSQNSIGKFLRQALRDGTLDPFTDALLFAADRTEHTLKEILPKIQAGNFVVSHRYLLSSVCYQPAKSDVDPKWIFTINKKAIEPDLTIILDVDPRLSMARIADRQVKEKFETIQFLDVVRANYKKYIHPPKVVEVDSSGPVEVTFARVLECCEEAIGCDLTSKRG
jgi:dTMP kinase